MARVLGWLAKAAFAMGALGFLLYAWDDALMALKCIAGGGGLGFSLSWLAKNHPGEDAREVASLLSGLGAALAALIWWWRWAEGAIAQSTGSTACLLIVYFPFFWLFLAPIWFWLGWGVAWVASYVAGIRQSGAD